MVSSSSTNSSILNIKTVNVTMYYYNITSQTIGRLSLINVAGDLYGYNIYKSKKKTIITVTCNFPIGYKISYHNYVSTI